MSCLDALRKLDQFKMQGTLIIPRKVKSKTNFYTSYGTIHGFFLTMTTLAIAFLYLVP